LTNAPFVFGSAKIGVGYILSKFFSKFIFLIGVFSFY